MRSRTTRRFRDSLSALPREVQRQARRAYERFEQDPYHSSLQFRRVHTVLPVYSARIGMHYRAVGIGENETLVWIWVGSHADYDSLLAQL